MIPPQSPPDAVLLVHGTFAHRAEDVAPDKQAPSWWQENGDFAATMDRLLAGHAACGAGDATKRMPWARPRWYHAARCWRPFAWFPAAPGEGSWRDWLRRREPFRPRYCLSPRHQFAWRGLNSDEERRGAARRLLEGLEILEGEGRPYHLIGHSHGGTVIWLALQEAARRRRPLRHLRSWTTLGTPFPAFVPVPRRCLLYPLAALAILAAFAVPIGLLSWGLTPEQFRAVLLDPRSLAYLGRGLTSEQFHAVLLDPSSPAHLRRGLSAPTQAMAVGLLLLAAWLLASTGLNLWWCWEWLRERGDAWNAWAEHGYCWLGLFSDKDEVIAGTQATVGFYAHRVFRLPWPGWPPLPGWNPSGWLLLVGWAGRWFVVPMVNFLLLPLAEWVISLVYGAKFQGADRAGRTLARMSPEPLPHNRARGLPPPALLRPMHRLSEAQVLAAFIDYRDRFARAARASATTRHLLEDTFKEQGGLDVIHCVYYRTDPEPGAEPLPAAPVRAIAAHVLAHASGVGADTPALASLRAGLDAEALRWLDARPGPALGPLSPDDEAERLKAHPYLPRRRPASGTPILTQVLLAGLALSGLAAFAWGVWRDAGGTYLAYLISLDNGPSSAPINTDPPPSRDPQVAAARRAFRARLEPILLATMADRGVGDRARAAAVLGSMGPLTTEAFDKLRTTACQPSEAVEVRIAAADSLGEIGPAAAPAAPGLAALLDGKNHRRLRLVAARTLGRIRSIDEASAATLVGYLHDADPELRMEACGSLITIGRPAVPALIADLATEYEGLVDRPVTAASEVLVHIGRLAARDLVRALAFSGGKQASDNLKVRRAARAVLERLGNDPVDELIGGLGAAEPEIRWNAAQLLAMIGQRPVAGVPPALEQSGAFTSEVPEARSAAAYVYVMSGSKEKYRAAVPPLIRALHEKNDLAPACATEALAALGPDAAEAARDLLQPERLSPGAGEAIVAIGRAAVPALCERLLDSSRTRDEARNGITTLSLLAKIDRGKELAVPLLAKVVGRRDEPLQKRTAAAYLVRDFGPAAAVQTLRQVLGDRTEAQNPEVAGDWSDAVLFRIAVVDALKEAGEAAARATPELIEGLALPEPKDRHPYNLMFAYDCASVLERIGPAAVPALADALGDGTRPISIRRNLPGCLAGAGPHAARTLPALRAALKDADRGVRYAAAIALERIAQADEAVITLLVEALGAPALEPDEHDTPDPKQDERFRSDARRALLHLGGGAVPALMAVFADRHRPESDRNRVCATLLDIGAPAARALVHALASQHQMGPQDKDRYLDTTAREILDRMDSKAVVPALVDGLGSEEAGCQWVLVGLLSEDDEKVAVPALAEAYRTSGPKARSAIACALVLLNGGGEELVPDLARALDKEPVDSRDLVFKALTKLGTKARAAVPSLTGLLIDTSEWKPVLDVLTAIGPDAAPGLAEFLVTYTAQPWYATDAELLEAVIKLMGHRAGDAVPDLTRIVESGAPTARVRAAGVLAAIRSRPALAPLIRVLGKRSEDLDLRVSVARALGRVGEEARPAVPTLIWALEYGEPRLRDACAEALARIHPEVALDLADVLRDQRLPAANRCAVLGVLAKIDPPSAEARQALEVAARDRDPQVSNAARRALAAYPADPRPIRPTVIVD